MTAGLPGSPAMAAARLPVGPMKRKWSCAKGFDAGGGGCCPWSEMVAIPSSSESPSPAITVRTRMGASLGTNVWLAAL